MPSALLLTLIALASPLPAAPARDPAALIDTFVRALTRDDSSEWLALVDRADESRFVLLADDLERYECVSVRGYRFVVEGPETYHLQLDASGFSKGAAHREMRFPPEWVLEVECAGERCRLRRAETPARRAARLLLEAPPASWEAVEICPDLDPAELICEIAEQAGTMACNRADRCMLPNTDVADVYGFALDQARKLNDRALESRVWVRGAQLAASSGKTRLSREMSSAAVSVAAAAGDSDSLGRAKFRLGLQDWVDGFNRRDSAMLDRACRLLSSAGQSIERLEDPRIAIKGTYMAGYVERQRGNLRDFLLDTENVIEWSRRYHWLQGASAAMLALGDMQVLTRNYALARDDFRAAYRYATAAADKGDAALAVGSLGMTQMSEGDLAAARETLDRAERMLPPTVGGSAVLEMEMAVGTVAMRTGRLDEAERRFVGCAREARRTATWQIVIDASTLLSQLRLMQKRPADALAAADDALALYARTTVSDVGVSPWRALLAKAKALQSLGRSGEAIDALRAAVDVIEDQRGAMPADAVAAARFFEDKVEPYHQLIDMLLARGRNREAFRYAEAMRAQSLQDVLTRGSIDRQSSLTAAEKEEERTLTQRLAELNKAALTHSGDTKLADLHAQIAATRTKLEQFEARVEMARPAARRPRSPEILRLPGQLGDGVVVEFVVGQRHTIAFAIVHGGRGDLDVMARVVPVAKRDLEKRVDELEREITRRDARWTRSAASLYDLLLAPFDAALGARRLVCIIPDDVLWRVPFHLLRRRGDSLVERAAIFYAPSLSTLQIKPQRSEPHRGELIAFGNPALLRQTHDRLRAMTRAATLGDLPDAESEVRTIASMFGERRSSVYVRGAARESTFKREAPRYRILHLAAHGILDDHSPMYSAIVLAAAPEEPDDGLLEAREILGLHLDSDLAVLAACDTARGHIGAGEGVIGVSWAFLVAGCPTTVVSQWQADSKATESLMIEFYRRLRAGESPALALRHAQLTLRADPRYHDPLYWAPFIVVGAGMRSVL